MLAGALFACGNDLNSLVMRKITTFIGISIDLICKDILHCGLCWGERERGWKQSFVGVDPDGDPRHRIVGGWPLANPSCCMFLPLHFLFVHLYNIKRVDPYLREFLCSLDCAWIKEWAYAEATVVALKSFVVMFRIDCDLLFGFGGIFVRLHICLPVQSLFVLFMISN